ncbi:MAG TPA: serine/threonine-protein kinase, partial [Ktedonobacterales bacterium]|nr:serine/threonine-protein kinase [Ktedonobacterales bacterium]
MARLEGQTIGGWHLQNYLGGGEHGEVYLVAQAATQKQAVMRVASLRLAGPQAPAGPSLAGRFSQEAQRLVELRHPSILPLYEYGQQNDLGYLVSAYIPDGSLQDAFTPGRPAFRFGLPLNAQTVGGLLEQVAAGLTYAHGRGVLHGNIKPANMLLSPDARGNLYLLLSDFGLPRLLGGSLVTASTIFYAAPEAFYQQLTEASDQYSLAMVVYQLLTGRLPFGGDSQQVMQQQMQAAPPPLRSFNPNVPPLVETVVLHALAKQPVARWPSVGAFMLAYKEALT